MTDLIFPDIFSPLSLNSGMGTKGNLGGSTESDIEPTPPPPTDLRTFLFPFTDNGLEAISGVPVNHQHASPQTEILNGQLVTYAADDPVISDVGLTGRIEDRNVNEFSDDITNTSSGLGSWRNPSNITIDYGAVADTPDGTNLASTMQCTADFGFHSMEMGVFNSSVISNASSYGIYFVVKPIGNQRYVTIQVLPSDSATFDLTGAGSVVSAAGSVVSITALNNGWYYIWYVGQTLGTIRVCRANIRMPDAALTEEYVGDPANGLHISNSGYSRTRLSQFSPIINNTGAALTRLGTAQIFGTVPVATTDTNYTLYCELTNLYIPNLADGDTFLLGYYTDGFFGTGNVPTEGWALLLTRDTGQLNLAWANIDGCAEGSQVPIAEWGRNETIQILFEVVVNVPNMIVSNSTGPTQSTPLTVLPTGMNTYGHLVDASALQVPTAYVATKYVMRLEDTGLTLAEAAAEARKPL